MWKQPNSYIAVRRQFSISCYTKTDRNKRSIRPAPPTLPCLPARPVSKHDFPTMLKLCQSNYKDQISLTPMFHCFSMTVCFHFWTDLTLLWIYRHPHLDLTGQHRSLIILGRFCITKWLCICSEFRSPPPPHLNPQPSDIPHVEGFWVFKTSKKIYITSF